MEIDPERTPGVGPPTAGETGARQGKNEKTEKAEKAKKVALDATATRPTEHAHESPLKQNIQKFDQAFVAKSMIDAMDALEGLHRSGYDKSDFLLSALGPKYENKQKELQQFLEQVIGLKALRNAVYTHDVFSAVQWLNVEPLNNETQTKFELLRELYKGKEQSQKFASFFKDIERAGPLIELIENFEFSLLEIIYAQRDGNKGNFRDPEYVTRCRRNCSEMLSKMKKDDYQFIVNLIENKHPHKKNEIEAVAFPYTQNPEHLEFGTIKVEIPKQKAQGVEVDDLLTLFDTINFSKPDAPDYHDLSRMKVANAQNAKELLKKFVDGIKAREQLGLAGVPGEQERRKHHYEQLENGITHILKKLKALEQTNPEKAKQQKASTMIEFLDAATECFPRQCITAAEQYERVVQEHVPTFTNEVYKFFGKWRDTYVKVLVLDRVQEAAERLKDPSRATLDKERDQYFIDNNVHYYSWLVERLGKELGIPGWEVLAGLKDPYAIGASDKQLESEKSRFFTLYNSCNIAKNLETELRTNNDLRFKCINWCKENMPKDYLQQNFDGISKEVADLKTAGKDYKACADHLRSKYDIWVNTLQEQPLEEAITEARQDQYITEQWYDSNTNTFKESAITNILIAMKVLRPGFS